MTLYNVRQISMDLVQQVLQGTNPYIEGPSLIWIISFYCLIFWEENITQFLSPFEKHELFVFHYWKKGPYLLYRAYVLNGPI